MWGEWSVQIVLKMLSLRAPPSCIPSTILTVVESLFENLSANLVQQLPSVSIVREWRSVLVVVTKTLAAYQLRKADSYEQLLTDGTSLRQTAIQNAVVGILTDGGFKMVTLLSGILAENKTVECPTGSVVRTFKEGGKLLEGWRTVLTWLYPHCQDLINMIPQSNEFTLTKLAKNGMVSTDTCNTARKTQILLCGVIRKLCFEKGSTQDKINVLENDCWNHLHNVWFGAIVNELSSHLGKVLQNDLNEIHQIFRVTTDPNAIFLPIQKFLGRLQTTQRDQDQFTMITCALTIQNYISIKSRVRLEEQGRTLVLKEQWLCLWTFPTLLSFLTGNYPLD